VGSRPPHPYTAQANSADSGTLLHPLTGPGTSLRTERVQYTPPNDEEQKALNVVGERLIRLAEDASISFVFDAINPPKSSSPHARATEADLRDAYDYGGHLIFATHDHLRTVLLIIKAGTLPSYAMYTLLRPAAEAAVRAKHLLIPTISETDRLARGLNERLDNLWEQRKAGVDVASIIDHLADRATANGISVERSKPKPGRKREITGFGEPVRSDLDLFKSYLRAGTTAFRFLSGHVHSKPWIQLPRNRARATATPTISSISTEINLMLFCNVLDSVLSVHDENIGHIMVLSGYPISAWTTMRARPLPPVGKGQE
jgi:hypothetical protein